MIEIEFSVIEEPSSALKELLEKFQKLHHVKVNIRPMSWKDAWSELLTCALYGKGPDVSHIGSTWSSSLLAMNALRPFSITEINKFGGSNAFHKACWQSCLDDGQTAFALPWEAYTHIILYRRELLQNAHVDEATAFKSAESMERTLIDLQASGVETPLILSIQGDLTGTLHRVSSWVWGAGGDYISPDGRRPLFGQPAALKGMSAFFNLYRFLGPSVRSLSWPEMVNYFFTNDVAVAILGIKESYEWFMRKQTSTELLPEFGAAPMPGVPWVGGDNLVVWKHSLSYDHEQVAVALASFLVDKAAQKEQTEYKNGGFIPTRQDALAALPYPESRLTQAVHRTMELGRPYLGIGLWSKVENHLVMALDQVSQDIIAGKEPVEAVQDNIVPLAQRLERTLS
jgi:multiple sugar transport system substrate-binding protein